ncbi:hypothetical protein LTR70_009351 [Exophiala xenobiotica]|uniref:Tyrosine specific protein phosphatases domain-containing protein n=1 Tax=Lithohypha guttulata TaxID=1690604 RepID=A0ABR0JY53_9EURO|nr:hypothetical protein LTR24_009154 [Lithohypha guttulata]KAK5310623.1 hypothetical protein LTR70_009351 [Exophiala xenobiotica]
MAESAPQTLNVDQPNDQAPPPPPHLPEHFTFPSHIPTPPFVNIDGVPNFRDMGGYLIASSYFSGAQASNTTPMMVRRGLLYRCAHPQLLTEKGNKTMTDDLGIKHIFDFRSAPEVKKLSASLEKTSNTDATTNPHSSVLQPDGITRHFTPVYEEEDYGPVNLARKLQWYTSAQSTDSKLPFAYSEGFVHAYRDIATHATISEKSPAAYPTILRHIINQPDEPLVFHCTAGKDRTGVLAALLLRLAGVDDETIAWEYALTEPGLGSWRNLFIERISKGGMGQAGAQSKDANSEKPKMSREEAARICGSRAGNVKAFLKIVVDGDFGGVEKYLVEKCGLTKDEVEKLRGILVVPVEKVEDVVRVQGIQGWTPEGGVQDGEKGQENGRELPLNENAGRETEGKVMAG